LKAFRSGCRDVDGVRATQTKTGIVGACLSSRKHRRARPEFAFFGRRPVSRCPGKVVVSSRIRSRRVQPVVGRIGARPFFEQVGAPARHACRTRDSVVFSGRRAVLRAAGQGAASDHTDTHRAQDKRRRSHRAGGPKRRQSLFERSPKISIERDDDSDGLWPRRRAGGRSRELV